MLMTIDIILVVLGLLFLILGSELAVIKAQRLARRFHISPLLIGLTLLAIGSDLPEIATNIGVGLAVKEGMKTAGIALGNVLGSSLAQITLVAGVAGLMGKIKVEKKTFFRDGLAVLLTFFLMLTTAIDGYISPFEGVLLIIAYVIYLLILSHILSMRMSREVIPFFFRRLFHRFRGRETLAEIELAEKPPQLSRKKISLAAFIFDLATILAGLALVGLGAHWVVFYGHTLAKVLGMDDVLIGLFLGLGTSLPELVISVVAVYDGAAAIGIGNILGSNILDQSLALGSGAAIAGLRVNPRVLFFEFPFLFLGTIMALIMLKDHNDLDRYESVLLILFYCLFLFLSIALFRVNV